MLKIKNGKMVANAKFNKFTIIIGWLVAGTFMMLSLFGPHGDGSVKYVAVNSSKIQTILMRCKG